jgi:YVTN family beta-propeller protein
MNKNSSKVVRDFRLVAVSVISFAASTVVAQTDVARDTVPVNRVIATVSLPKETGDPVVSPDNNFVYLASTSENSITVVNTQTNKVQSTLTLPAGGDPTGLAISPDGSKLYVRNTNAATVTVVDLANANSTQTITGLAPLPVAFALTPDGKQLWVSDGQNVGNIDVIDTASNKVLAPITVPEQIGSFAFSPDGLNAYVIGNGEDILVVDTTSHQVTATIRAGKLSQSIVMSPTGKTAYVVRRRTPGTHIMIINTTLNQVIKNITLTTDALPGSAALLPDGSYLYVIRSNSGRINLLDTQTQSQVGGGFTVAPSPSNIAIAPNGERAYISYDSNKLKVIKITE